MATKRVSKKAAAVEDKQLRDYELVLIIRPDIADEKIGATIDNVTQFITGKSGIISDVENRGKRKLAYAIKHLVEGNYVLARFKLNPKFTKELKANLQISEDIMRHLLVGVE